jgi:phospholipase/carboxylesterase
VKPLIASKEKIKNLNVFVSHGTNDNIIPVNEARASVAYLKTLGITPLFKEYPEVHTISNAMFADMLLWLKK